MLSGSFTTTKDVLDKKDNLKQRKKTLLNSHIYTCDYAVKWNPEYKGVIFNDASHLEVTPFFVANITDKGEYISYLEVKPEFDFNNMTRLFVINQKWVYEKYKIYVQLFKPLDFYRKFFVPDRYLLTDKKTRKRKINFFYLTFDQWYDSVTNKIKPKTDEKII